MKSNLFVTGLLLNGEPSFTTNNPVTNKLYFTKEKFVHEEIVWFTWFNLNNLFGTSMKFVSDSEHSLISRSVSGSPGGLPYLNKNMKKYKKRNKKNKKINN